MLRTYKYTETKYDKLQQFVLAFFDRILNETGDFSNNFYEVEFYNNIVSHHPKLLGDRFETIYEEFKTWPEKDKKNFNSKLKEANEIEKICSGAIVPIDKDQLPDKIKVVLRELFIDLYEKILKKSEHFFSHYGNLLAHYQELKKSPNNFVLCPACGIKDVKTVYDDSRDQYDHYLPKDIYPLSAINFKNLVPICIECNSLEVKSNKDVIKETNGVLFFPFCEKHEKVQINISVDDDLNYEKMNWIVTYQCAGGREKEIDSWKYIFNIESRHVKFIRGKILKWYKAYWSFMNNAALSHMSENDRNIAYMATLEADESVELSFIKLPAIRALMRDTNLAKAEMEARFYSAQLKDVAQIIST